MGGVVESVFCFLGGLKDSIFKSQAESSKIVRQGQPFQTNFGIFRKKVFKRPHTTTPKGALFFKIII